MISITGIGVISAIGNNANENWVSLMKEKSGISKVQGIQHLRKPFLGAQVKHSNDKLKSQLGIDSTSIVPRSTLLSMIAAKEALGNLNTQSKLKTTLISATSVGGMDLSEQFYINYKNSDSVQDIDQLSTHDNGAGTELLADFLGIEDEVLTLSTACSSAANAILLGARMIRSNRADRVLVGGADALCNFTMNGFDSLMIYDQDICKPFDNDRKGLNLGEAAGFLLLENEKSIKESQNKVLAQLNGWANTNDSYHQTASSPDGIGATLAISKALEIAKIKNEKISYINAHGTATPNNDLSESTALRNIFGDQLPAFSSTKGYTGHTLAAAGGIEAVYAVLALQNQKILPNINFQTPMEETGFVPVSKAIDAEVNHILSNSFGFGGNCTSLIFSK